MCVRTSLFRPGACRSSAPQIVKAAYAKYDLSLGVGLSKINGKVFRIGECGTRRGGAAGPDGDYALCNLRFVIRRPRGGPDGVLQLRTDHCPDS